MLKLCTQKTTERLHKFMKEPFDYVMESKTHYITYRKHKVNGRNKAITNRILKDILDD